MDILLIRTDHRQVIENLSENMTVVVIDRNQKDQSDELFAPLNPIRCNDDKDSCLVGIHR